MSQLHTTHLFAQSPDLVNAVARLGEHGVAPLPLPFEPADLHFEGLAREAHRGRPPKACLSCFGVQHPSPESRQDVVPGFEGEDVLERFMSLSAVLGNMRVRRLLGTH